MKKIVLILLAVVLIGGVLFLYSSFNGNPISKAIAKNTVENYVVAHYPQGNYDVAYRGYNFKDGTYMFDFTYTQESQKWSYTLEAGHGFKPTNVETITLHADSADYSTSEQWSNEGTAYLKNLLAEQPAIRTLGYSIDVPSQFTQFTTSWSPTVAVPVAPIISIELEYTNQTQDEFLRAAEELQQILDQDSLIYRSAYITAYEEIDNKDGSKEGYASTYYEGRYRVTFVPGQVLTVHDVK